VYIHLMLGDWIYTTTENSNTPSDKKDVECFSWGTRWIGSSLSADKRKTRRTTNTQWICYLPSVNSCTRHLQYIRWVYLSNTRRLPICRVSTRDTRQNLIFFLPLGFKLFLQFSHNMWYSWQNLVIFIFIFCI
jgi:hypothetical protein